MYFFIICEICIFCIIKFFSSKFINILFILIDNVFVGRYLVFLNMVKLLFDVSCGLVLM